MRTDIAAPHTGLAPSGYGPGDLRAAYDLPGGSAGAGETVAVVDAFDDPNAAADLATYRQEYGLPACGTGCFTKVNENGDTSNYPQADKGWAVEESLDIEMVSAICPACHILLVEASDNSASNLGSSVNTAVSLGAKYISNSYGGPELPDPGVAASYNHPGVAVTASAGDSGYGVSDPAGYPGVVSAGGTSLLRASNSRGWDEIVWTGTGSGCSAASPKPAWQIDSGCATRTANDVAAVADPETGVAIYDSYQEPGWGVVGGTSVSSPIIASVYALAGRPAPGTNPASYLYTPNARLNDIVAGTNFLSGNCTPVYLCNGVPGFDGPTGQGTPDGVASFRAPYQYVAMGDSFASGEGVPPYYPDSNTKADECHRSQLAYATMVKLPGQSVPAASQSHAFAFIACSGAETTGIAEEAAFDQDTIEAAWNAAGNTDWGHVQKTPEPLQEMSAVLGPGTKLITVSIGGNDARFADVMTGCLLLAKLQLKHCSDANYVLRRDSVKFGPKDPSPLVQFEPEVLRYLVYHLVKTYVAIHKAAPNARIVVTGYPHLFPANATRSCNVGSAGGKLFSLSAADQNWLNDDTGTVLNQRILQAVQLARIKGVHINFVDPTAAFTGHALCSAQPWINPLTFFYTGPSGFQLTDPGAFHPNQAGQAAYARLVNACLAGTMTC